MPRKTCKGPATLLRALRRLEEDGQSVQVGLAEILEARHGRTRIYAARALEVGDLEPDALVLGALGRQIRGPEVGGAGPEVRVTVQAACLGEDGRSGYSLLAGVRP